MNTKWNNMRVENIYQYTPLPEPVPIIEQSWPEGTLPLVHTRTMTYMHEKYIRDCIEGILVQRTTFPVQVLIHDDASIDKTASIVHEYAEKYPKLIRAYYQKENTYSTSDKYERRAEFRKWRTGKYEALCEGDDYWTDPLKLQKQVDFLEAHPEYAICFCNVQVIYEESKLDSHEGYSSVRRGPEYLIQTICEPQESTDINDLALGNYIHTPGVVFRNWCVYEHAQSCEFLQKCPTGDWALHMHTATLGKIRYMREVMAIYRVHRGGIWSQKSPREKLETGLWVAYWATRCSWFSVSNRKYWMEKSIRFYLRMILTDAPNNDVLPIVLQRDKSWCEKAIGELVANCQANRKTISNLKRYQLLVDKAEILRRWQLGLRASVRVALFGSGDLASWTMLMLDRHRVEVVCVFDNLSSRTTFQGLPVRKPVYVYGVKVIVSSSYDLATIHSQLNGLGYADKDIVFLGENA